MLELLVEDEGIERGDVFGHLSRHAAADLVSASPFDIFCYHNQLKEARLLNLPDSRFDVDVSSTSFNILGRWRIARRI